jgi:hypothetical protein
MTFRRWETNRPVTARLLLGTDRAGKQFQFQYFAGCMEKELLECGLQSLQRELWSVFSPPGPDGQGDAKDLFLEKCSVCHGPDGAGKTAKGKKLKVKDVHQTAATESEADMTKIVTEGKGKDTQSADYRLAFDLVELSIQGNGVAASRPKSSHTAILILARTETQCLVVSFAHAINPGVSLAGAGPSKAELQDAIDSPIGGAGRSVCIRGDPRGTGDRRCQTLDILNGEDDDSDESSDDSDEEERERVLPRARSALRKRAPGRSQRFLVKSSLFRLLCGPPN